MQLNSTTNYTKWCLAETATFCIQVIHMGNVDQLWLFSYLEQEKASAVYYYTVPPCLHSTEGNRILILPPCLHLLIHLNLCQSGGQLLCNLYILLLSPMIGSCRPAARKSSESNGSAVADSILYHDTVLTLLFQKTSNKIPKIISASSPLLKKTFFKSLSTRHKHASLKSPLSVYVCSRLQV